MMTVIMIQTKNYIKWKSIHTLKKWKFQTDLSKLLKRAERKNSKKYIHIYKLLENRLKESRKNNKSIWYMFVKDIYILIIVQYKG